MLPEVKGRLKWKSAWRRLEKVSSVSSVHAVNVSSRLALEVQQHHVLVHVLSCCCSGMSWTYWFQNADQAEYGPKGLQCVYDILLRNPYSDICHNIKGILNTAEMGGLRKEGWWGVQTEKPWHYVALVLLHGFTPWVNRHLPLSRESSHTAGARLGCSPRPFSWKHFQP